MEYIVYSESALGARITVASGDPLYSKRDEFICVVDGAAAANDRTLGHLLYEWKKTGGDVRDLRPRIMVIGHAEKIEGLNTLVLPEITIERI